MTWYAVLIGIVAFALAAAVIGCLLAGIERKISARMQGRVGPPIMQPFYDVRKLLAKEDVSVSGIDGLYISCALVITLVAGGMFFSGGDLLMCAFMVAMSALFYIMAAYSSRSPYAELGAGRETLQVMAYEPAVIFMAVCFFLTVGTFNVVGAFSLDLPPICSMWPIFIAWLYVLTIKLRKSPFDLSTSHHAHQELVKGTTTEMSGKTLAKVEVMHWYETVLFLGWTGMFFLWGNPISVLVAIAVALVTWFFEIWVDNNFARVKWQAMLKSAWLVALVAGTVNLCLLVFM